MFGLGEQQPSEEELKKHQEQTNSVIISAAYVAALLWTSPMLWSFIRKQWK
ncbi:HDL036Cp [Eremothecium sinecaudum]|uniref:HDL036Cp n=1 Tax=Eremothecium sinecaudum TaxID=45286 RepID=A0A0X8HSQ6_9SACH|nr:HDL036Cp [Eremothecium sinecaudum]AMD20708.1 HDL036Cp [Eremothecium sinecaudum]